MTKSIRRLSALLAFTIIFSLFAAFPAFGVGADDGTEDVVTANVAGKATYRGTDMSNGTTNYGEADWNVYHTGKLNDGVIPTADSASTKGQNVEIYISGFVPGTVYVYFKLEKEENVKEVVAHTNARAGSANRGYPTTFNVYVGNSETDISADTLLCAATTADTGYVRKYSAAGDKTGSYVIFELGIASPYIVIALAEVEIYATVAPVNHAPNALYKGDGIDNGTTGNYCDNGDWEVYHSGKLNDGVIPADATNNTLGQNVEFWLDGIVGGTAYVTFKFDYEVDVREVTAYFNCRSTGGNRGYPTKVDVYVGNSEDVAEATLVGEATTTDTGYVRAYSVAGKATGAYVIFELTIANATPAVCLSEVEIMGFGDAPDDPELPKLSAPVLSSSTGKFTYTIPTISWETVENAMAYDVYLDGALVAENTTNLTYVPYVSTRTNYNTSNAYAVTVVAKSGNEAFLDSDPSEAATFIYVDKPTDAEGNPVAAADFIIDAGHGGTDPGALGNGGAREEADDNLAMALAVGKRLTALGFTVAYTRITDVYDTVLTKAAKGEAGDFGYYLCFHRNSYTTDAAKGIETLYKPDANGKNKALAQVVQDQLTALGMFSNRGVKERTDLAVLNNVSMPAILMELSFISNPTDNENYDKYFGDIATAVVKGATTYAGYKTGFEGHAFVNGLDYTINGDDINIHLTVPNYDPENSKVALDLYVSNGLGISGLYSSVGDGAWVQQNTMVPYNLNGVEGFLPGCTVMYSDEFDYFGATEGTVTLKYKITHALEAAELYKAEDLIITLNITVEGKDNTMPFDITSATYNPQTGKITVEGYAKDAQDQWHTAFMVYANVSDSANVFGGNLISHNTVAYGDIKTNENGYFKVELDAHAASLTGNVYVAGKYVAVPSAPDAIRVRTYLYFDKNAEDAVDGATTETLVYVNDSVKAALTSDQPTRPGYLFKGWAADADGTAIADDAVVGINGCTVYAIWAKDEHTVTFVDRDGNVIDTQIIEHGSAATAPEAPVVEGYDFAGWDTAFDNISKDITVTATYTIKIFTVTFVGNTGIVLKAEFVEYGGAATAPEAPKVEGCDFAGWDKAFDNISADITVTAIYTIKTLTVNFYLDTTLLKSETVEYGSSATPPSVPRLPGFEFVGWDKAFDNISADVDIYAVYVEIPDTFTVTFVADGVTIKEETVAYGAPATAPEAPAKEGYTFAGWDKAFDNITADTVVTAIYEINTYTVTFVADGVTVKEETVEHGSAATAPEAPAKEGYTFTGWDKAFDNITADTTVTAVYTIKTFYVHFLNYDGSLNKEEIVEYGGAATAPTDIYFEGHDFVGWDVEFDNVTSNLTVAPIYTPKTYTVTFKGMDGTVISTDTVTYCNSATAPNAPEVSGYRFLGWDKSFDRVVADMVVTAVYERVGTTGDVNGDGLVDNTDASLILKYDAGLIDETGLDLFFADVDGDGLVDNTDASLILKYDAGLIPSL